MARNKRARTGFLLMLLGVFMLTQFDESSTKDYKESEYHDELQGKAKKEHEITRYSFSIFDRELVSFSITKLLDSEQSEQ